MANRTNYTSEEISNSDVLMASIGAIGMLSNIALLAILVHSKKFRDISYVFIINVAFSDFVTALAVCCLTLRNMLHTSLTTVIGQIFCKILYFVFCTTYDISAFSLAAISWYRYKIIVNPLNCRSQSFICKHWRTVIIAIWSISLLISSPTLLLITSTNVGEARCDIYYPYGYVPNVIYFSLFFIITYLIPLLLMSYNYIRIGKNLYSRTYPNTRNTLFQRRLPRSHRNANITRFLIGITCVYMTISGPIFLGLTILSIAGETYINVRESNYSLSRIFIASLGISASICFINPVLCLTFDRNIRLIIRKIIYKVSN